ncbi:MAG: 50S ribosomal protein L22 [Candidatus Omnitrophota bacterium]
MIAKASIKYLRVSPRKLRLLLPLIRYKKVPEALFILENTNKKAAAFVYKAVHSAAANAKRFPGVTEENLFISKIYANGGPVLKRYRSRPMGMASMIRKRTTHLYVEIESKVTASPVTKSPGHKVTSHKSQVTPNHSLRSGTGQANKEKKQARGEKSGSKSTSV